MTDLDIEINRIKQIMLIHERKQNILQEYHRDQKFPTADFEKTNAEAYLDWLEDKGKYGTLPPSKISFEEGVKSGLKTAAKFAETSTDKIYDDLQHNTLGFWREHIEDKNGKLYVERSIETSDLGEQDFMSFNYKNLIQKYENNVGGCWSWKPGSSSAYCGEGDDTLIFKGYIRMEDVDWEETDYINSTFYSMAEEREVRVKPNAKVELFEIETSIEITKDKYGREIHPYKSYNLPLKKHLIVTATYFGNNETYHGDYALLYQAQSKDKKVIDRKGNIFDLAKILKNANPNCNIDFTKGHFNIHDGRDGFRLFTWSKNKFSDEKYNFIDENYKILSPNLWFDNAYWFSNGFARVYLNEQWNFLTQQGDILSPNLWFDEVDNFYNRFAKVRKNNEYNLLTKQGDLLSPNLWLDEIIYGIRTFRNDCFKVKKDEKYNLIDVNGNFLSPNLWFEYIYDFSQGLARVVAINKENRYIFNFINKEGQLLSPNQWFDFAGNFHEGFARIDVGNISNYITVDGNLLSPNQWFEDAEDFNSGYANILVNGVPCIIDKQGNITKAEEKD